MSPKQQVKNFIKATKLRPLRDKGFGKQMHRMDRIKALAEGYVKKDMKGGGFQKNGG